MYPSGCSSGWYLLMCLRYPHELRAASAQLIPEDTSQRGPSARCGCSVRSGWKVRYVIANGSANSAKATVLSTAFCQKPDHNEQPVSGTSHTTSDTAIRRQPPTPQHRSAQGT